MLDCQLKHDYIGKKSYSILSYESNDQCWEIMRGGLSNSVPRLAPSITVVELGVIHLVHVASQIWTQGDATSHFLRHLKRRAGGGLAYSNIRLALCDVATSYTNRMLAILPL